MAAIQHTEFLGGNRTIPAREELRRFFDVRARRTQGCLTCRQRKVKCDQRRPSCDRCRKGMHQCLGYDEPFLFVNQALPGTEQPKPKKSASKHKEFWHSYGAYVSGDDPGIAENAENAIAPMVPLIGFKDNIVISHFVSNLRIGFEQNPASTMDAPTMQSAMESLGGSTSAYVSGLSVAEAYFSQIHKVDNMMKHSAGLYGQALGQLRSDLQSMNEGAVVVRSKLFLNLWTAYFLSLYELVSSAGTSQWLQHASGVAALIRMLGPTAFQSASANALYEVKRPFISVAHIVMRKRCFLEGEEWITGPWANAPETKLPGSYLMDVFVTLPGLLEEVEKLKTDAEAGLNVLAARTSLQDKILVALNNLCEARWKWEEMYPRVCWKTRINLKTTVCLDEEGKPLFDTCLNFVGMKRTFEILFYDSARLLLYRLSDLVGLREDSAANMEHVFQRHGPFLNPLLLPGLGTRESHALEICRIVDYLLNGEQNYHGAYVLLFPLRIARMHLEALPKVFKWVGQLLTNFAEEKGLKVGEYIQQQEAKTPGENKATV